MFERFTKLFSKTHEDQNQIQIGNPGDLRKGDANSTTRHDVLPKFQPEGLISLEAAQAKLSKEDQTKVLPPWRRPAPISLQDAKGEFATVAEAQAILKDATHQPDRNGAKPADEIQPTVTPPATIKPGNNAQQTGIQPANPAQWVSAKPTIHLAANEILQQNQGEPTSKSAPKADRGLERTHSSKQL
jgi:hypothetical protein